MVTMAKKHGKEKSGMEGNRAAAIDHLGCMSRSIPGITDGDFSASLQ